MKVFDAATEAFQSSRHLIPAHVRAKTVYPAFRSLDAVNRGCLLGALGIIDDSRLCICGCGRPLGERVTQRSATPACRKRLQKRREAVPTISPGQFTA